MILFILQVLYYFECLNQQTHSKIFEIGNFFITWHMLYPCEHVGYLQSLKYRLLEFSMQFYQKIEVQDFIFLIALQIAATFSQNFIDLMKSQHSYLQFSINILDMRNIFAKLWRTIVPDIREDNLVRVHQVGHITSSLLSDLLLVDKAGYNLIKPPSLIIDSFVFLLHFNQLIDQFLNKIFFIKLLLFWCLLLLSFFSAFHNLSDTYFTRTLIVILFTGVTLVRTHTFYGIVFASEFNATEVCGSFIRAYVFWLLLILLILFVLFHWRVVNLLQQSMVYQTRVDVHIKLDNNIIIEYTKYMNIQNLSDEAVSVNEDKNSDKHVLNQMQSDALTYANDHHNINLHQKGTRSAGRKCCWCCRGVDMNVERLVRLEDGYTTPKNTISNAVNNQKYNLINFLPLVLFNQFKLFFNFFQLAINLSQFVPILKVGFLFSYLSPLVMVMMLTLGKEAYDDWKRYRRDKQSNSSKFRVIKGNNVIMCASQNIRVGDILELHAKDRVPADVVILSTSEHSGSIFIKTDQLDGETDWKVRRSVRSTHARLFSNKTEKIIGSVMYAPACDDIYDFLGSFTNENGKKESLSLDNTAWANTVVAAGSMIAIVIFTGKQTRSQMNSRQPSTKIGRFDQEINHLSKVLFVIMLILALVMNIFRQVNILWPLYFFRYVLLLSSIIPISLRVNLDFCKTYFSYKITNDELIPGTICRNSAIPEQLGRVEYLLSDKTGTLTYNDMIFKKLSVNEQLYTADELEEIKKGSTKACRRFQGPLGDIHDAQVGMKKMKRRQQCILRDLLTSLILCNNVTPVMDEGARVLQASSPDQIALVKFAESVGFLMRQREKNSILILNPADVEQKYQILANFPFSSETKRMGIIVKHEKTGRIMLYLKGADMVMIDRCKPIYRGYIQDECDTLAREGLRTLVITQKELDEKQYEKWSIEYEAASNLLKNRHEATKAVMQKLQHEMDLVGITGVEDRLQDQVAATIEALRMGGIKVWMLTGDKVETAKCIAISAGLKSVNQEICEIKGDDELMIRKKLLEYDSAQQVLLIDGGALTSILNSNNSSLFFETAKNAPAVICCRCLPTQKALITQKLKNLTGTIVAGIGDGGNDVGMIQLASIGLGIVGKEGNHAASASDVSMKQFKYTKQILLWHGRNAYRRAAALSQFVIHRGLIISILQMAFSIIFYNVAIPIYNGMLMLGYATLYTSLPVFSLILDQDLSRQKTLMYPNLYINLRKSRQMNTKTFLIWVWMSIYQGVVIMVMGLSLFQQSFVRIVTITFTALILSQLLNVITTIHHMNRYIFASIIITIIIYGLSLLLLQNYLNTAQIDMEFLWKVGLIVAASWVPIFVVRCIRRKISPSEEDKIKN